MAVLATFARMCVNDLDGAIDALNASGVAGVRLRFEHATGLQLALVGNVLVLAGSEEMLEPFLGTDLTVIVDDLDDAISASRSGGAEVIREPAAQTVGRNVTVSYPAGPVIEFVEWDQNTKDVARL